MGGRRRAASHPRRIEVTRTPRQIQNLHSGGLGFPLSQPSLGVLRSASWDGSLEPYQCRERKRSASTDTSDADQIIASIEVLFRFDQASIKQLALITSYNGEAETATGTGSSVFTVFIYRDEVNSQLLHRLRIFTGNFADDLFASVDWL